MTQLSGLSTVLLRRLEKGIVVYILIFGLVLPFSKDWTKTLSGDYYQNLFWLPSLLEPDLFVPDDLLVTHARYMQPPGLIALYRLGMAVVHPILFCKLVGILNILLFLYVLLRLANLWFAEDSLAKVGFLALLARSRIWGLVGQGLARSFAPTFGVLFLLLGLRQQWLGLALLLVLAGAFHPISFAVGSVYCFLILSMKRSRNWRAWLCIGVGIVVGLMVLVPKYLTRPAELGPAISLAEAQQSPAFGPQGRWSGELTPSVGEDLLIWFGDPLGPSSGSLLKRLWRESELFRVGPGILVLGLFVWGLRKTPRSSLRRVFRWDPWVLVLASMVCYVIARVFAYRFYVPNRYLVPSDVVLFYLLVQGTRPLWNKGFSWGGRRVPVFLALFILLCLLNGFTPSHRGAFSSRLKEPDLSAVSFLSTAPKHALIAGPPRLMDRVVTYCERSAYFTHESLIPLHTRYYEELSRRVRAYFAAYFASDWKPVLELNRKEGVDLLVVRNGDFEAFRKAPLDFFYAPYNQWMQQELYAPDRHYVLEDYQGPAVVWSNSVYRVIDLRRLEQEPEVE